LNKPNALWFQASNVDRLLILKEGKLTKQEGVINEEKTFPMMIDEPLSKILKTYIVL
jgi:hypothetical protein